MSCLVQKIFAIKSQSRRKPTTCIKCYVLNFADDQNFSTAHCLLSVWQSLIELRLLTSVCEAWRWSRMQNLQRVSKNDGPVLSRLWTKVHGILRRCRRTLILSKALPIVCRLLFRKHFCHIVEKPNKCIVFGPQFLERVDPNFSTSDC